MRIHDLGAAGWRLKEFLPSGWVLPDVAAAALADTAGWIPATVPGSVQGDLLRAGLLADPYRGRGSLAAEWAENRTWVYSLTFDTQAERTGRHRLRFGGIDYAARIVLNGIDLGTSEGMSTPVLFDVTDVLMSDRANELVVVLAPAPREQDQLGRTSLVESRKSRMGYWWDFCPRLVNLGLIGAVTLESADVFLDDVAVHPQLSADHAVAQVAVDVLVSGEAPGGTATVRLLSDEGGDEAELDRVAVPLDAGRGRAEFTVRDPRLWWPNGYGDQARYRVEVRAGSAVRSTAFGIRSVELARNETDDADAPPYVFVVNGRRMYITGWNWVPVDALYGEPHQAKVRHLLELAARSHANLVRVNGVGRIETEHFYDTCDRLGLMVWQEFLLTSSATDRKPREDREYVDAVVEEARAIVPLLRNAPSLVLWCAGNELESLEKLPLDDREPVIAALREVATELDPDTVWLPTSARGRKPFNGPNSIREDPDGLQDVHGPWLFQGLEGQYSLYNAGTSLFHSEIGAEGLTNPETAREVLPAAEWVLDRADSPTWRHVSAWWVRPEEWRQYFGAIDDFDQAIAATQFLQAEAVRYAVESNRRRAYRNSGSLPWQLNEPFPMVGSTAAVDYFGRPKELYSAVQTAYAPLALSARYDRIAWGGFEVFDAEIWAVNAGGALDGHVTARVLNATGDTVAEVAAEVSLAEDRPTRLFPVAAPITGLTSGVFLLDLVLRDVSGRRLAGNRVVFSAEATLAPLLALPRTRIDASWSAEGESLVLHNAGPVLAPSVRIFDGRPPGAAEPLLLDRNHVTMLPGETRAIGVQWGSIPAEERSLQVTGLNIRALRVAP